VAARLPWKHFRAPLGSVVIGIFGVTSSWPAARANEAAGEAKTTKNAKATFTELLNTRRAPTNDSLNADAHEADVGPQSADTIKLNFRFPSGQDRQTGEAMGIHPDDER